MNRVIGFAMLCLCFALHLGCKVKETVVVEDSPLSIQYSDNTLVEFIIDNKLSNVLEMANDSSKLTFVEFYTDWCLPCQIMDESVFMNKPLSEYYNSTFVNYKLNGESEEGKRLGFVFQVSQYPTFVILDQRGRVVAKEYGGKGVTDMMLFGENAVKEYAMWMSSESGE